MGFKRFFDRARLQAILKTLAYSVAVMLSVMAVFFVLTKRMIIPLNPLWSLLFGAIAGALAFFLLFFVYRPNDKSVARRLDDEFMLEERVTTMLELNDSESPMADLQREDTESRLSRLPSSGYKLKRMWAMIAAMALSLAMLVTGLVIPAVAAPEEPDPIIDDFSRNWRIVSLMELIERVEDDKYASETVKEGLITVLRELISIVESTDRDSTMRGAASRGVATIDTLRRAHVTAIVYGDIFRATEREEFLDISKSLKELNDYEFEEAIFELTESFASPINESIIDFVDVFNTVISSAGIDPTSDPLTALFVQYSTDLRKIADNDGDIDDVADLTGDFTFDTFEAILAQADNNKIIMIVRAGIISIFELTADDFADTDTDIEGDGGPDAPTEDKEDEITPGAGYGKGDKLAGSTDSFYDHDSRGQVKLPDVVDEYYNKFDEIMDELDEDLKSEVEEYFDILQKPESLL